MPKYRYRRHRERVEVAILQSIKSLRRARDIAKKASESHAFDRGMAAGFHMAAHYVWRDYKEYVS